VDHPRVPRYTVVPVPLAVMLSGRDKSKMRLAFMAAYGAWDAASVKHRRLRQESLAGGGSGHVRGGQVLTIPNSVWSVGQ